jgi:hypothetical protein
MKNSASRTGIIVCKSMEELDEQNQATKNNKKQKFELIIPKEIAKQYFDAKKEDSFDNLWKGKIYLTYRNGILSSFQFEKGTDY